VQANSVEEYARRFKGTGKSKQYGREGGVCGIKGDSMLGEGGPIPEEGLPKTLSWKSEKIKKKNREEEKEDIFRPLGACEIALRGEVNPQASLHTSNKQKARKTYDPGLKMRKVKARQRKRNKKGKKSLSDYINGCFCLRGWDGVKGLEG